MQFIHIPNHISITNPNPNPISNRILGSPDLTGGYGGPCCGDTWLW